MPLSHRIPVTPWRAKSTWSFRPRMALPLFLGLSLFGLGEGLLVQAQWGASPWTVFAQGVAKHTHWALGWSTAAISLVVLLVWFPLRERPGFGTVSNVIIIAYVLDLVSTNVAVAHANWLKIIYVLAAVVSIGAGSALYLTTGLGPGPRDGLMTGLHRRLGISVVYIRLSLELTVLVIGWLMGGTVGIATAFFAATVGFSIGVNLNVLQWATPPVPLVISGGQLVTFIIASMAIIIVPGPSVLFTLARGVAWGRTVAVFSVLGNSLGTLVLSVVVAVGLGPLLADSKAFSITLQVAGGLYLLWLGYEAYRHRQAHAKAMTDREASRPSNVTVVRQGFTVGILNPKSLVFFAAVFPHFVDRTKGNVTWQLLVFGGLFSIMAFCSDATWGIIAGTAREWLSGSPHRLVVLRSVGAVVMMFLGCLILASAVTS